MSSGSVEYTFYAEHFAALSRLDHLPGAAKSAMRRALMKTMTAARAEIGRRLKAETTLKPREITQGIWVGKPKWDQDGVSATLFPSKNRLPVMRYNTRPASLTPGRTKNIAVQVLRQKAPSPLRHAFAAKMKSGHVGVFERMAKDVPRLPIEHVYGPSLSFFFFREDFEDSMHDFVEATMPQKLLHEISWIVDHNEGRR